LFLGQFEHAIDEKGRMIVPARFREELGDSAYITRAFDNNLTVMCEAVFESLALQLNELSITDPSVRQLQRLVLSNAGKVEFDKVGRILIPQKLREAANLHSEAVLVGQGNRFEIWSPDLWEEEIRRLNSPEVAERFKDLKLPLR
jgi:MraZ protein